LFKEQPGYYNFFTDDKEYQAFVASDLHYPSNNYPYPKKWANKHYLAMINKHASRGYLGEWALLAEGITGQKFETLLRTRSYSI